MDYLRDKLHTRYFEPKYYFLICNSYRKFNREKYLRVWKFHNQYRLHFSPKSTVKLTISNLWLSLAASAKFANNFDRINHEWYFIFIWKSFWHENNLYMNFFSHENYIAWKSFHIKSFYMKIISRENHFKWKSFHMKIISHENHFAWKLFHMKIISHENHFTWKSFHMKIISHENHFTWKSFHMKIISHENHFTWKSFNMKII